LICSCLIGGCFEDHAQITLNPDGSGTIKHRIVLSDRFVVANSESASRPDGPIPNKEELLEKIGSAIEVQSVNQKDLPDGSRVIELEGTFSGPEQFFLSEYCLEQIKLRLSPVDKDKAAVYCVMKPSGQSGPELSQLYGMAKGLIVKRSIHLPGSIQTTNGQKDEDTNRVSWAMDLRDRKALAETKEFLEGPSQGEGKVAFDASALQFELPLKAEKIASKIEESEPDEKSTSPAEIKAGLSWISVTKAKQADGAVIPKKSFAELGLEVTWNEGHRPVRCEEPVVLSLLDDNGQDLAATSEVTTMKFHLKVREHEKSKEIIIKAKAPSASAKKLKSLEGYVEVVTEDTRETIVLENIRELAGKESTGNPVLDKLGLKIKEIQDRSLKISIDEGTDKILSVELIKEDGSKVKRTGGGGWKGSYSYEFRDDISELKTCELEVITGETKVKIPFSVDEIALP
jgi:hypothetical protein